MSLWSKCMLKYVKKHKRSIIRTYKDEIKREATDVAKKSILVIKDEYIEKCKPPPLAQNVINHFVEYYSDRIEGYIDHKLNELIGDETNE